VKNRLARHLFVDESQNCEKSRDPDIRIRGEGHINPDILLGRQFNMFPSISRLFLRWREAKVYSQTGWGPWTDFPSGSDTAAECHRIEPQDDGSLAQK